jgi:hypothetical protein
MNLINSLIFRVNSAWKPAAWHFAASISVCLAVAAFVLLAWYPGAYGGLSGGKKLLLIIFLVDAVCGPLLTLIAYSPVKPLRHWRKDFLAILLLQFVALAYGVWTLWQARPLYLVFVVDRYKVVSRADIEVAATRQLPSELRFRAYGEPIRVNVRKPANQAEMLEAADSAILGGRDMSERPQFYEAMTAEKLRASLGRAKPIESYLNKYPQQRQAVISALKLSGQTLEQQQYLPVIGADSDWIVLIDKNGQPIKFLVGDGF